MTWDVEAHPPPVIAHVPAIATGDCHLTAKGLDPAIGFAEAWQVKEAGCYPKCAKDVPKPSSSSCHLLTADDAETLQELSAGLGKPSVCLLMQAAGAATDLMPQI